MNTWTNHGSIDECLVYGLSVTVPHEPITSVKLRISRSIFDKGENDETDVAVVRKNHDKDKISSFYIYRSPSCFYVPSGIADNFQNVKVLVIAFTGLKEITREDLKPLILLENLYIDNNELESLDKDLFISNSLITTINLSNNKIKSVGIHALEPLTNLQKINFSNNACIDLDGVDEESIKEVKRQLSLNCAPELANKKKQIVDE